MKTEKDLLAKLLLTGGKIVNTNELSDEEVELARAEDRLYVDKDGFGFAVVASLRAEDEVQVRQETVAHQRRVSALLSDIIAALQYRAQTHDESKLSSDEFHTFVTYTPRLREMDYGSEEYSECLAAMEPVLRNHYARNRHHPEYFADGVSGMTLVDLVEMLCDWKAASERHNSGSIFKSLQHNRRRFDISKQLYDVLYNTAEAYFPGA